MISLKDVASVLARFQKGIMYLAFYVLIIATISFPFTGMIIKHMEDDLIRNIPADKFQLIQIQPLELMILELKLSFIIGILAALPIVFFFGYRYMKVLKLDVRFHISKAQIILVVILAIILFFLGCAYAYLLMLPLVYQYLMQSAASIGIENSWQVSSFVDFTMMTTFVFGVVFELPLIMTALARVGLVPVEIFKKYRRHMYVIILVVAALVTSPDVLTQIMVGVPLIIFYEISIFSMRFTVPRRIRIEAD